MIGEKEVYDRYEAALSKASQLKCYEDKREVLDKILWQVCETEWDYFNIAASNGDSIKFTFITLHYKDQVVLVLAKLYKDREYIEVVSEKETVGGVKISNIAETINGLRN